MINTEILSEKIKYLIITESGKEFDIMTASIDVDEYYDDDRIKSYNVDVRFDYLGVIDPEVYYFARDIQKMSDKMRDIIGKYVINSKGKIVLGGENVTISDGFIWSSKFTADETHEFQMSFKVTSIDED